MRPHRRRNSILKNTHGEPENYFEIIAEALNRAVEKLSSINASLEKVVCNMATINTKVSEMNDSFTKCDIKKK